MQTVFSQRLLAELRTFHGEEGGAATIHSRTPDDVIDPDDSGPRLSITLKESSVDEIYALQAAQAEQTSGCYPDTTDQLKASQLLTSTPAPPDLLDSAVLRTMPVKVAAFMMYEPPSLSSWSPQETAGQRQERELFEELGGWCG
jgi:hypothetical protein